MNALVQAILRIPEFTNGFPGTRADPDQLIRDLREAVQRGYLTKSEFMRLAEKKGRFTTRVSANRDADVQRTTREAFQLADSRNPVAPVMLLKNLAGVDVRMASAILAWTHPDKWAVIDVHAWRALKFFATSDFPRESSWLHRLPYYLSKLRFVGMEVGLRPQQIDRWLYSYSKTLMPPLRAAE